MQKVALPQIQSNFRIHNLLSQAQRLTPSKAILISITLLRI